MIAHKKTKSNTKITKGTKKYMELKFYRTKEVADILQVVEPTVRKWIKNNKLKATKLAGNKTIRISREALNEFIERKN